MHRLAVHEMEGLGRWDTPHKLPSMSFSPATPRKSRIWSRNSARRSEAADEPEVVRVHEMSGIMPFPNPYEPSWDERHELSTTPSSGFELEGHWDTPHELPAPSISPAKPRYSSDYVPGSNRVSVGLWDTRGELPARPAPKSSIWSKVFGRKEKRSEHSRPSEPYQVEPSNPLSLKQASTRKSNAIEASDQRKGDSTPPVETPSPLGEMGVQIAPLPEGSLSHFLLGPFAISTTDPIVAESLRTYNNCYNQCLEAVQHERAV